MSFNITRYISPPLSIYQTLGADNYVISACVSAKLFAVRSALIQQEMRMRKFIIVIITTIIIIIIMCRV
jgi:hypothetical protein